VEWAEDQRPENDVREIIMVGQTPPPVHGQSVMNKYLLDGIYRRIRLHHVRLAFSTTIEEVGGFRFRKLMHLTAVLLRIVRLRARHAGAILYFAPAGPRIVPFLRDCLLLIPVRWMFAKTAFHFHASGLSGFRATLPGILRPFFDAAYGRPDLAISISSSGRVDGDSLGARETVVIPNGIPDETKRIPFTQRGKIARPRILFVGMVSAEKGVETLLEACVLLRERGCDFHCDIVGNGPSEMEIHRFRTIIRERGLSGMVTLDGPLHGMNKWKTYASADIFCFPTHYSAESFGLVAVEAMMFGLPVVATHWRGLPDIVADGETGFLVPVKDPALLAERLARLLADPALRVRMGEEGRRRYERLFTVKRFREMMEKALSFESPFRLAPVTISVVTPSLNQIKWLRLCIQSVADQVKELSPGGGSRLRVEHIVQDGGSQEIHSFASEIRSLLSESHGAKEAADLQPGEILHMDTPSGYTLRIFSETDGGMYQGINSGLNKAKGSICCWLNCDEQYMEGTLVRVARFFQEMPGMDVLLGDAVLLSEELRPLAYRRIMRPTRWHTRLDHLHTLSCAMFFRRQALPVPALEEKWKVIGDVALMDYFLKSRKKIYACGKLLSAYCFTGENLSATPTEELVTWWRETRWPPRVFKPLTVLHHRVRRLFHGAYRMRHVRGRVWMEGSTQRRRIDGTLSGVWISEKPQA
jgi:glycosyltransferase involved in cell wall biosynthesis